MKKKYMTSIRFDEKELSFAMEKLETRSPQDVVNYIMGMFWSYYHPLDNVFDVVGVPKNEVSKPERVLIRREPIETPIVSSVVTTVVDSEATKKATIKALQGYINGAQSEDKPKDKQRSFEDYKRWKRDILPDDVDGQDKFKIALAEDEFLTAKQKVLVMG